MKKTQKKLGNKGFSLVELIVVIAIMAVLVGVLAPTLIKNIEKSRKSKDEQNLDTVKGAITTVLADDLLSDNVVTITGSDGTITITSDSDTKPDGATNTLKQELTETISKEKVPMTSKDLKSKTIKFTITNGKVSDYNAS